MLHLQYEFTRQENVTKIDVWCRNWEEKKVKEKKKETVRLLGMHLSEVPVVRWMFQRQLVGFCDERLLIRKLLNQPSLQFCHQFYSIYLIKILPKALKEGITQGVSVVYMYYSSMTNLAKVKFCFSLPLKTAWMHSCCMLHRQVHFLTMLGSTCYIEKDVHVLSQLCIL